MKTNYFLAAAVLLAASPLTAHAQTATPVPTSPALASAAQPVTLRLKFTPGQTLYYSMVTDTNGTVLTGQSGAGMPIQIHMQMLMHQTVKSVRASDGAATLDVGIDTISMGMNGQTMPMPPEKLAPMKTIGTMVILPTGKTVSFTPSAGLSAAGPMPGMDLTHMNAMGRLGQFPDAPVKAGDTWKSAVAMGMMGTSVAAGFMLLSLDTVEGKTIAIIKQTTNGTFDTTAPAAGTATPMPAGMAMNGNVDGTGTLRFDVDAGAVVGQTSRANVTMVMTPPGATAPMNMQMKVSSTLKRASAPAAAANPAVQ